MFLHNSSKKRGTKTELETLKISSTQTNNEIALVKSDIANKEKLLETAQ